MKRSFYKIINTISLCSLFILIGNRANGESLQSSGYYDTIRLNQYQNLQSVSQEYQTINLEELDKYKETQNNAFNNNYQTQISEFENFDLSPIEEIYNGKEIQNGVKVLKQIGYDIFSPQNTSVCFVQGHQFLFTGHNI